MGIVEAFIKETESFDFVKARELLMQRVSENKITANEGFVILLNIMKKQDKQPDIIRYIYVLKDVNSPTFKIGIAQNVEKRRRALEKQSGRKIQLKISFVGSQKEEKEMHDKYKKYRLEGEWFRWNSEIKKEVEDLLNLKYSNTMGGEV
jgi:hypothetical protein